MSILINDKQLETFKFPGGECHVKINKLDIGIKTAIIAYLNNSDDIICLLLATDAIRRVHPETAIHLTIPYFPYARQDRVCNEGESLSVKVMTSIINSLSCTTVTLYDPHSDVTPALLNNCRILSQADIIMDSILSEEILNKKLVLVSPDAGAEKKTLLLAKSISTNEIPIEIVCSSKTRDPASGKIIATEVYGDVQGKNLIIVDDICDGGGTFIALAQALKDAGANDIYLYITHGIFSKGFAVLQHHFKHIYCYHFINQKEIAPSFVTALSTADIH